MPNTSNTPFWGPNGYTLRSERSGMLRNYFRLGRKTRKVRKLMETLLGAAAGSSATLTHKVVRNTGDLGGVRPVDVFTDINRVTTAADVTNTKNYLTKVSKIATPTNRAGSFKI